jgi:hypothetical protein
VSGDVGFSNKPQLAARRLRAIAARVPFACYGRHLLDIEVQPRMLCRQRHKIENTLDRIKDWRRA